MSKFSLHERVIDKLLPFLDDYTISSTLGALAANEPFIALFSALDSVDNPRELLGPVLTREILDYYAEPDASYDAQGIQEIFSQR